MAKPQHEFHIRIDRKKFEVTDPVLTGAQLRALPEPDVAGDRDLFLVRPGDDDLLIGDADPVTVHDGLRLFTAPRNINPGS